MKFRFRVQLSEEDLLRKKYKRRSEKLCLFAVVCLVVSLFVLYSYLNKREINWIWLTVAISSILIIIMHNIFVGAIDVLYDKLSDSVNKYAKDAKEKEKENKTLIEMHARKEELFRNVIRAMLNISVREVVEPQLLIQKVLLKSGQKHYVDIIESKR